MLDGLFSLAGRVALVTGGNGGIGRAIALGYRAAGATVVVTGRDPEKNRAIAADLGDPDAVTVCDVRDEAEVERTVAAVVARHGRLDVLVNNAGAVRSGSVITQGRETFEAILETNLVGAYLCAKHAAAAMIRAGRGGKIVNVGSIYSTFGPPDFAGYATSKAGLAGLTRALAVELAPNGIQVNTLEPGYVDTDMSRGVPDWLREQLVRKTPAGRFGRPEDLVGAAVLLASRASDYMTGSTVRVDGGYAVADRLRYEPRVSDRQP